MSTRQVTNSPMRGRFLGSDTALPLVGANNGPHRPAGARPGREPCDGLRRLNVCNRAFAPATVGAQALPDGGYRLGGKGAMHDLSQVTGTARVTSLIAHPVLRRLHDYWQGLP